MKRFALLRSSEFVRVMMIATILVICSRIYSYFTSDHQPKQTPTPQSQPVEYKHSPTEVDPDLPKDTPTAIADANRSVVMLRNARAVGSGIILSADGLVLTNGHVVQGGGMDGWKVLLSDERELPARVVNAGATRQEGGIFHDLALVQIEGVTNLPVARLASNLPQEGETVWAIGAPYARDEVVTSGILRKVTLDGILLTSTEVHPGNSGGPLLNQQGEVIGINTEINPQLPGDATTASISATLVQKALPALKTGETSSAQPSDQTSPPAGTPPMPSADRRGNPFPFSRQAPQRQFPPGMQPGNSPAPWMQ